MARCVCYLAALALASCFLGRCLPDAWLQPESWLYRCRPWEKAGKVYEKLGIRHWQNKVPDMSRILPKVVPPKQLNGMHPDSLLLMIRETCIAELTHLLLMLFGFWCLRLWPGPGGWTVSVLFALGNVPFILIQRYNRPRFQHLQSRRR